MTCNRNSGKFRQQRVLKRRSQEGMNHSGQSTKCGVRRPGFELLLRHVLVFAVGYIAYSTRTSVPHGYRDKELASYLIDGMFQINKKMHVTSFNNTQPWLSIPSHLSITPGSFTSSLQLLGRTRYKVCWNGDYICLLGCRNKDQPQTGWLKQQKCISSQLHRLEVQDQGVNRIDFFWGLSPSLI